MLNNIEMIEEDDGLELILEQIQEGFFTIGHKDAGGSTECFYKLIESKEDDEKFLIEIYTLNELGHTLYKTFCELCKDELEGVFDETFLTSLYYEVSNNVKCIGSFSAGREFFLDNEELIETY